jgi:hypothetical protein
MLKRGFEHCFVCLEERGAWFQLDADFGIPVVRYLTTSDYDLAKYWREDHGFMAVETLQGDNAVTWPWALRNCVGFVKGILCINSWTLTPYGLYKYLRRRNS